MMAAARGGEMCGVMRGDMTGIAVVDGKQNPDPPKLWLLGEGRGT